MNGRPPFFFAPPLRVPVFFAAPFFATARAERFICVAIALRYRLSNGESSLRALNSNRGSVIAAPQQDRPRCWDNTRSRFCKVPWPSPCPGQGRIVSRIPAAASPGLQERAKRATRAIESTALAAQHLLRHL